MRDRDPLHGPHPDRHRVAPDGGAVTRGRPAAAFDSLADLLAAASCPARPHELRGESAVRAAFEVIARSWSAVAPTPGRSSGAGRRTGGHRRTPLAPTGPSGQ
ncbi:MAG: hypothetical protein ABSF84_01260 [Acidimicrobiales bacterium]